MTGTSHLERSGGIRRYLDLTAALAQREFLSTYRGNLTGTLASFAVPLVMLVTYTFVFSTLIPIRVRPEHSTLDYAFFLFAGLIAWNLFADVAGRAPRLFLESPQYVTKPLFPISAIVAAPCLASFYRSLPWLGAFAVVRWAFGGVPPSTFWLAPVFLLWTMLLTLGVALTFASVGTLVRDVGDLVPPALTLLFFLSPVLYPPDRLDKVTEWIMWINPLAPPISMLRGVTFYGVLPTQNTLVAGVASTLVWGLVGWLSYRLIRPLLQDLV